MKQRAVFESSEGTVFIPEVELPISLETLINDAFHYGVLSRYILDHLERIGSFEHVL